MAKISELILRYLHKKLVASEGTPTQYTASSGTVKTAVCAALTEADNYWNGAVCRWDTGTNAGLYSTVRDFDAATDTLTFDQDLPAAVVNTDKFTLFLNGKYMSDQRIPGMTAAAPVNCTGVSITYAGMINAAGTGTLKFYYHGGGGAQTMSWTPPGGTEGAEVLVGALALAGTAELLAGGATDELTSQCLLITRTAAALPVSDKSDAILISLPENIFLAPIIGAEVEAGVTFYRPIGLKNTAASKLYAVAAYCPQPFAGAVATVLTDNLALGAGTLKAANLASWGSHGWVINTTKNDIRYFYSRSGNQALVLSAGAGLRGFTAVAWDNGDAIEPFPWQDIGLDAPGAGSIFEDPADAWTAPAGVVFSAPRTAATGLAIGDLAAAAVYCVWERFVVPAGFQPLLNGSARVRFYAEATE